MRHLLPNHHHYLFLRLPFLPACLLLLSFLHQSHTPRFNALTGPLTGEQRTWLEENPHTGKALSDIAGRQNWSDRQKADAVFDYFTEEADPLLSAAQLSLEVAVLKVLHPEWSSARTVFTAAWNVTKGKVHTALDLVGLVPGFGEGADLVNGILYVIEGDNANAKISFAASIPGIGWAATGAKYGIILLKVGKQVKKLRISRSGNFYIFSHNSSNAFRKILQITNPDIRAHHIIPKEFWSHPAIQKAAQAKNNPFHMNHKNNGWPIPRDFHSGSHPNYSDQIRSFLNDLQRQNLSFEELAKKLKKKQDDIINVLKISPATKIDEIVIP